MLLGSLSHCQYATRPPQCATSRRTNSRYRAQVLRGRGRQEVGRLAGGPRRAGADGEPDRGVVARDLAEQRVDDVEVVLAGARLDLAPVDVGTDQAGAERTRLGHEVVGLLEEPVADPPDDSQLHVYNIYQTYMTYTRVDVDLDGRPGPPRPRRDRGGGHRGRGRVGRRRGDDEGRRDAAGLHADGPVPARPEQGRPGRPDARRGGGGDPADPRRVAARAAHPGPRVTRDDQAPPVVRGAGAHAAAGRPAPDGAAGVHARHA